MARNAIATTDAAREIGPLQVPLRRQCFPVRQILWTRDRALLDGDISAQSRRVFDNLRAVCAAAGGSFDDVVRIGIYLVDLGDFAAVNAVLAEYFTAPYPARSTIEVSGLPRGARVEVDAILAFDEWLRRPGQPSRSRRSIRPAMHREQACLALVRHCGQLAATRPAGRPGLWPTAVKIRIARSWSRSATWCRGSAPRSRAGSRPSSAAFVTGHCCG